MTDKLISIACWGALCECRMLRLGRNAGVWIRLELVASCTWTIMVIESVHFLFAFVHLLFTFIFHFPFHLFSRSHTHSYTHYQSSSNNQKPVCRLRSHLFHKTKIGCIFWQVILGYQSKRSLRHLVSIVILSCRWILQFLMFPFLFRLLKADYLQV